MDTTTVSEQNKPTRDRWWTRVAQQRLKGAQVVVENGLGAAVGLACMGFLGLGLGIALLVTALELPQLDFRSGAAFVTVLLHAFGGRIRSNKAWSIISLG